MSEHPMPDCWPNCDYGVTCPHWDGEHNCGADLFNMANAASNPMHGLPGAMAVSDEPPTLVAPEFPPVQTRCPHGTVFYAYPNAERIAVLRAMNAGSA